MLRRYVALFASLVAVAVAPLAAASPGSLADEGGWKCIGLYNPSTGECIGYYCDRTCIIASPQPSMTEDAGPKDTCIGAYDSATGTCTGLWCDGHRCTGPFLGTTQAIQSVPGTKPA